MIKVGKDWCTSYQLKFCQGKHAWTQFSRQDADQILKALSDNEFMVKGTYHVHKQGRTDAFHPRVSSSKSWGQVVTLDHHANMTFPELYDCEALRQRMVLQKGRLANIVLFRKAHRTRVDDLKKAVKHADTTNKKNLRTKQEEQDATVQTLEAHLTRERELLHALQRFWEQDDKAREMPVQCTYTYKSDVRCRRTLKGVGAQTFSRVFRDAACANVRDFDFHTSMFSIVIQLVDKLEVSFQQTLPSLPCWRAVAKDRRQVCEKVLGCSPVQGKSILLHVACGKLSPRSRLCPSQVDDF